MKKEKYQHTNRNRKLTIFIVFLIVVMVLYIYNCISMALNVQKAFKQAFYTGEYNSDLEKHMNKDVFDYIEKYYLAEKEDIGLRKADTKIIFALNNIFFSGAVWMKYSFETKSKKDGHLITGCKDNTIYLSLKRRLNQWQIVKIYHPPY